MSKGISFATYVQVAITNKQNGIETESEIFSM